VARGLANNGHTVHVVTPDLEHEEQRGSTEYWWGPNAFPADLDVLVEVHNLEGLTWAKFNAPILICMTNGIDPWLGDNNELAPLVDGWPCFSQCHVDLLTAQRPVDKEKCFVTGLGVDPANYTAPELSQRVFMIEAKRQHGLDPDGWKMPGRLFFGNDPARGLWHVLDIYDRLAVAEKSLHIGYDFYKQLEARRWQATATAELLWECKRRIETTVGVVSLGNLSQSDLVREELECQVHAMPSDPPNLGSQIHGITQMECAAAGAALVLSDTEAFPEIFGGAATILPLPGTYLPEHNRRYDAQDWAEVIEELMKDPAKLREASHCARALAEQHTWAKVVENWEKMLEVLALKALGEKAEALVS